MARTAKQRSASSKQRMIKEFRQREILNAARKIFARKGFAGSIVNDIAVEAGVAKGTIYLYFASKKDIYNALLHNDMEVLRNGMLGRMDAVPTLRQKIVEFALARLENAESNREVFRIMDTQSSNLSFTRSQYRDWLQQPVEHLAKAIEASARAGEVTPVSAERTAWAVADLSRGAINRRLLGSTDATLAEEAEFIAGLIWSSLCLDSEFDGKRTDKEKR